MVKKIKSKEGQEVLELSRFDRIWFCSECKREFKAEVPAQCPCGAQDKVFLEKTAVVEETPRRTYTVLSNIIFDGAHIDKGTLVSLIVKDKVTKNLLQRKLISEAKEAVKEEVLV